MAKKLCLSITWDLDLGTDPDPITYRTKLDKLGLPPEIVWELDDDQDPELICSDETVEELTEEYGYLILDAKFVVEESK